MINTKPSTFELIKEYQESKNATHRMRENIYIFYISILYPEYMKNSCSSVI